MPKPSRTVAVTCIDSVARSSYVLRMLPTSMPPLSPRDFPRSCDRRAAWEANESCYCDFSVGCDSSAT